MTSAQKIAKEKFKKAIAYRQKSGVSLKEAFAHVYGKKKVARKKVAKKRIAGPKDSSLVRKELARKGLKMPHGYTTTKRKRKISGVKKKKISETGILNRIHKVKHDVERLDEAQHKHMSMSGMRNINVIKEIESTKNLIVEQTELLDRLQKAYKKSVSKINKQMIMLDIKTLKNNFIPHNKRYLKQLQSLLKKSI
jgi:hypothetical protein